MTSLGPQGAKLQGRLGKAERGPSGGAVAREDHPAVDEAARKPQLLPRAMMLDQLESLLHHLCLLGSESSLHLSLPNLPILLGLLLSASDASFSHFARRYRRKPSASSAATSG